MATPARSIAAVVQTTYLVTGLVDANFQALSVNALALNREVKAAPPAAA